MKDVSRYINYEKIARVGWQLIEPKWTMENPDPQLIDDTALAFAAAMGEIVVFGPDYPQVMDITPSREQKKPAKKKPGQEEEGSYFNGSDQTPPHGDLAWGVEEPPKFIVLACVVQSEEGGESFHANAFNTYRGLPEHQQRLLAETDFNYAAPPHHPRTDGMVIFENGRQGVVRRAMNFDANGEMKYIRVNPNKDFFDLNAGHDPQALAAMIAWDTANREHLEIHTMIPGQFYLTDNWQSVHGRKEIMKKDPQKSHTRHLKRVYASPFD